MQNKIVCGDIVSTLKKLKDAYYHLMITSPPYNVGLKYENSKDNLDNGQYLDFMAHVWKEVYKKMVVGGRLCINIAPTGIKDFFPIHHHFIRQLTDIGARFRAEIIWYKQNIRCRTAWGSFKSPSCPYVLPSWEYVLIFDKSSAKLNGDSSKVDITNKEFVEYTDAFWKIPPEKKRYGHPAPFPEELVRRLIKLYSYVENNILDPFNGIGTTCVVACKERRFYTGIDISKEYCDIAMNRLNEVQQHISKGVLMTSVPNYFGVEFPKAALVILED